MKSLKSSNNFSSFLPNMAANCKPVSLYLVESTWLKLVSSFYKTLISSPNKKLETFKESSPFKVDTSILNQDSKTKIKKDSKTMWPLKMLSFQEATFSFLAPAKTLPSGMPVYKTQGKTGNSFSKIPKTFSLAKS